MKRYNHAFSHLVIIILLLVSPFSNDLLLLLSIISLAITSVLMSSKEISKKQQILFFSTVGLILVSGVVLGNFLNQQTASIVFILFCNLPILIFLSIEKKQPKLNFQQ